MFGIMIKPKQQTSVDNIRFYAPNIDTINNKYQELFHLSQTKGHHLYSEPHIGGLPKHDITDIEILSDDEEPNDFHHMEPDHYRSEKKHLEPIIVPAASKTPYMGDSQIIKQLRKQNLPLERFNKILGSVATQTPGINNIVADPDLVSPDVMSSNGIIGSGRRNNIGPNDLMRSNRYRYGAPKLTLLRPDVALINRRTENLINIKEGKPEIPIGNIPSSISTSAETVKLISTLNKLDEIKKKQIDREARELGSYESAKRLENLKLGQAIAYGLLPDEYRKYIDPSVREHILRTSNQYSNLLKSIPRQIIKGLEGKFINQLQQFQPEDVAEVLALSNSDIKQKLDELRTKKIIPGNERFKLHQQIIKLVGDAPEQLEDLLRRRYEQGQFIREGTSEVHPISQEQELENTSKDEILNEFSKIFGSVISNNPEYKQALKQLYDSVSADDLSYYLSPYINSMDRDQAKQFLDIMVNRYTRDRYEENRQQLEAEMRRDQFNQDVQNDYSVMEAIHKNPSLSNALITFSEKNKASEQQILQHITPTQLYKLLQMESQKNEVSAEIERDNKTLNALEKEVIEVQNDENNPNFGKPRYLGTQKTKITKIKKRLKTNVANEEKLEKRINDEQEKQYSEYLQYIPRNKPREELREEVRGDESREEEKENESDSEPQQFEQHQEFEEPQEEFEPVETYEQISQHAENTYDYFENLIKSYDDMIQTLRRSNDPDNIDIANRIDYELKSIKDKQRDNPEIDPQKLIDEISDVPKIIADKLTTTIDRDNRSFLTQISNKEKKNKKLSKTQNNKLYKINEDKTAILTKMSEISEEINNRVEEYSSRAGQNSQYDENIYDDDVVQDENESMISDIPEKYDEDTSGEEYQLDQESEQHKEVEEPQEEKVVYKPITTRSQQPLPGKGRGGPTFLRARVLSR